MSNHRHLRVLLRDHLEKIAVFGDVVRHGSLHEASRALHTGQPAITRLVRSLEDAVGAPLLLRTHQGVTATHAGSIVIELARMLDIAVDRAAQALAVEDTPRSLDIRIGAYESIATQMAALMKRLLRKHPQWTFRVRTGRSDTLLDALARGEIELAFVASPNVHPELRSITLFRDLFAFFAVPGKSAEWLSEAPIITMDDARDQQGCTLIEHVTREGFGARIAIATDSFALVRTYAEEGLGIGILPQRVAAGAVAAKKLRLLPKPFPPGFGGHETSLAYRTGDSHRPGLDAVLRELVSFGERGAFPFS